MKQQPARCSTPITKQPPASFAWQRAASFSSPSSSARRSTTAPYQQSARHSSPARYQQLDRCTPIDDAVHSIQRLLGDEAAMEDDEESYSTSQKQSRVYSHQNGIIFDILFVSITVQQIYISLFAVKTPLINTCLFYYRIYS